MHTLSIIGKRTITTTTSVLLKIVIYLRSNFSIANIIQKYNKFSTNIIYYNKLPNSSRAKLVGRHYVLGDFLPNTLTMQIIYVYTYTHTHTHIYDIYIYIYIIYIYIYSFIYIYVYIYLYIYIYIYIIYTLRSVVVSFLPEFILVGLELGKKWGLNCSRNTVLSAMTCWCVFNFQGVLHY